MLMIASFFAAALATVLAVPLIKGLATRLNVMDHPVGGRHIHTTPVPRLGGVAVFLPALAVALVGLHVLAGRHELSIHGRELLGLLAGTAIVFGVGIYDDICGLSAPLKLAGQVGAAILLYSQGIYIDQISTPFGKPLDPGFLELPLTVLWLVALTNGMNLLDGVDGLAAGVGAMGALSVAVLSAWQGASGVSLIAIAVCGSLVGFLIFNFHPAAIFLGDCGALTLGFLLAALPVAGSTRTTAAVALLVPIIALGVPIFDTTLAVVRRAVNGKNPFEADCAHLHHRLLSLGLNQRQVSLTLYVVSACLTTLAILMANASRQEGLVILLVVGAACVTTVRGLGLDEIKILWGMTRHGERRRRPPRYRSMLIRKTLPLLERCKTSDQMRRLLGQVQEGLDLQSLRVRFSEDVHSITLNGFRDIVLQSYSGNGNGGSSTPKIFHLASEKVLWIHKAEIVCQMVSDGIRRRNGGCRCKDECAFFTGACGNGRGRVVGEVVISKPAWKKRRASEADDELIELLAEGLGRWVAAQIREGVRQEVLRNSVEWAEGAQEFALRVLSLVEANGSQRNGHARNVLLADKR